MLRWVLVLLAVGAVWLLTPTVTVRDAASVPTLRDASGRLVIGCGFGGTISAPQVCHDRRVVAIYLDDTTPNLAHWVALAVMRYRLVIVARPVNRTGCPYRTALERRRVLCAQEYYPYNSGYPVSAWGPLPRARAFILQYWFSFTGRPPSAAQRARLLREARARHPKLILLY